ncbi:MAG: hypothetical protein E7286_02585 [Lachnospiraceae bacterium]|nr:hypothetical protein [Lachnospiraceae bacterium]
MINNLENQNTKDRSINDYRSKLYKVARRPSTMCVINKSTAAKAGILDRLGARLERKEDGVYYSSYIARQVSKFENRIHEIYAEMECYHASEYAHIEELSKQNWRITERLNTISLKILSLIDDSEKCKEISSDMKKEINELSTVLNKNKREIKNRLANIKLDFECVQKLLKNEWSNNTLLNLNLYIEYALDSDFKNLESINWEVLYPVKQEAGYIDRHLKQVDIYSLLI